MPRNTPKPPEGPKGFKTVEEIFQAWKKIGAGETLEGRRWLAVKDDGMPILHRENEDQPEHRLTFEFSKDAGDMFVATEFGESENDKHTYIQLRQRMKALGGVGFVPAEGFESPKVVAGDESASGTPPWEGPDQFADQRSTPKPAPPTQEETPEEAGTVRAVPLELLRKLSNPGKESAALAWNLIRALKRSPDFTRNWQNIFNDYRISERLAKLGKGESEKDNEHGTRLFQQGQMRIGYKPKDIEDAGKNVVPTLIIRLVRKWKEFEVNQTAWKLSPPQVRALAAFVKALEDLWENDSAFRRELQEKKIGQVVIDSGGLYSLSGEKLKELLVIPIAFGMVPEEKK